MHSPLYKLYNLWFTCSYQIFRLVSGNTDEQSVKDFSVQKLFLIAWVLQIIFFFQLFSFHCPGKKEVFQERWIQDEGLLKEPSPPRAEAHACSAIVPRGHQRVWGEQIEVLGFMTVRRGSTGWLALILQPEQPTLLPVHYHFAIGSNPLLGVGIPTSLSLNAVCAASTKSYCVSG